MHPRCNPCSDPDPWVTRGWLWPLAAPCTTHTCSTAGRWTHPGAGSCDPGDRVPRPRLGVSQERAQLNNRRDLNWVVLPSRQPGRALHTGSACPRSSGGGDSRVRVTRIPRSAARFPEPCPARELGTRQRAGGVRRAAQGARAARVPVAGGHQSGRGDGFRQPEGGEGERAGAGASGWAAVRLATAKG